MINNSIYIQSQQEVFDVVIVGSGAGGGMAAHTLTKAGAKVCVLEAGQPFDPADPKNITQLKWPYESPRRGTGTTRAFGDFDAAYGGWEIDGEPYTLSLIHI
jgi:choline dehydrogenase-like flavoprotein